jgi:pyruvate/2-oxoacid:ferredoxin oxidoreductase alpha subunit
VLKQIEGSGAVAEAVAMCRPQLICAYSTTPQTQIVEALGAPVKKGELNAGFLNVESKFAAMSTLIDAVTNQEAADLHIQAFRIAEELSNPVMVCMDGFLLTHASERADIPGQDEVDAFLPTYQPRRMLDPDDPVSIGTMVGPEAFTEVRFLTTNGCGRPRADPGGHRGRRPA